MSSIKVATLCPANADSSSAMVILVRTVCVSVDGGRMGGIVRIGHQRIAVEVIDAADRQHRIGQRTACAHVSEQLRRVDHVFVMGVIRQFFMQGLRELAQAGGGSVAVRACVVHPVFEFGRRDMRVMGHSAAFHACTTGVCRALV